MWSPWRPSKEIRLGLIILSSLSYVYLQCVASKGHPKLASKSIVSTFYPSPVIRRTFIRNNCMWV